MGEREIDGEPDVFFKVNCLEKKAREKFYKLYNINMQDRIWRKSNGINYKKPGEAGCEKAYTQTYKEFLEQKV